MSDKARLFDLVRYARGYLHDAGLITDEEFSEILTTDSINSVKRLESYDEVQAKLAAAKADVARLTDERDRALAGARASDDERAQAVESMREATAEVERLKGEIALSALFYARAINENGKAATAAGEMAVLLRAALRETREALAFVIGDHSVPSDCYSSGPVTGTPLDAICPSCRGVAVLARYAGLAGEVENG